MTLTKEKAVTYQPIATLNRFLQLHQLLLSSFSENLEQQHEVTLNEFRVLMMVGQLGETASHEIAEATAMPPMAIARTVAALESRGLVRREVDENNRRRKPIRLTGPGTELFEQMMPTSNRVAEYLFDSLRIDEMLMFDHFLGKLVEQVSLKDERGELVFVKRTREQNDE